MLPLKDVQKDLEMFLTVTMGWAVYMLLPFRRQTRGMLLNISQCADDTPKQSYPAQNHQCRRHREQICSCKVGGDRGWDGLEFGVSRCKLLHREWTNNKAPLYSTGNYIQYPRTSHDGKEYTYVYMYVYLCVCITASLCYTAA